MIISIAEVAQQHIANRRHAATKKSNQSSPLPIGGFVAAIPAQGYKRQRVRTPPGAACPILTILIVAANPAGHRPGLTSGPFSRY
jgi:hypothetical protein